MLGEAAEEQITARYAEFDLPDALLKALIDNGVRATTAGANMLGATSLREANDLAAAATLANIEGITRENIEDWSKVSVARSLSIAFAGQPGGEKVAVAIALTVQALTVDAFLLGYQTRKNQE